MAHYHTLLRHLGGAASEMKATGEELLSVARERLAGDLGQEVGTDQGNAGTEAKGHHGQRLVLFDARDALHRSIEKLAVIGAKRRIVALSLEWLVTASTNL